MSRRMGQPEGGYSVKGHCPRPLKYPAPTPPTLSSPQSTRAKGSPCPFSVVGVKYRPLSGRSFHLSFLMTPQVLLFHFPDVKLG